MPRLDGLETVEPRHPDVEDHRVRGRLGQQVKRFLAVARELDVVALEPQRTLERAANGRLIVDNQNARHQDNCGATL